MRIDGDAGAKQYFAGLDSHAERHGCCFVEFEKSNNSVPVPVLVPVVVVPVVVVAAAMDGYFPPLKSIQIWDLLTCHRISLSSERSSSRTEGLPYALSESTSLQTS
jgi:hypothetical protein